MARIEERCHTLGPGVRTVIWVQGCPLRCRECVAVEMLPFEGGTAIAVDALARRLLALASLEGLTLSGGEPFAQPEPLVALVNRVRAARPDLSVMSYSGFTLERLRGRRATPPQRALLERLDLLIDGPYLPELHGDLLWRGSSNQRLHVLSDRHPELRHITDRSSGFMVRVNADGSFRWDGVPAVRGFRAHLARLLAAQGLRLVDDDEDPT